MPLTRYQLRNEFSLADPDLYRAADKDDAEALFEGVAMAGLVGVLRQLGDLAEFAAEIFHDLLEEVMATAARGHTLMGRVQQLEAEVPALEKEFLSRTNHSSFYTNAGVDWHPNLHMEHNLITQGDLPRCVMDSYEECWGPPRLFLLDKFDIAGAGACLKRYTDPSFFKNGTDTSVNTHLEVQREKRTRKSKKKGSRWKNADAESVPTSNVKLHQLFLEENIENAFSDPTRLVKLKKRPFNGSPFAPKSGKRYMEKFLETTSPDIDPDIYERTINLPLLKMTSENSSESGLEIVEIRAISPKTTLPETKESASVSADEQDIVRNACVENLNSDASNQAHLVMLEPAAANDIYGTLHASPTVKVKGIVDGGKDKRTDLDGDHSDDITSEVENFMDALPTIDSEIETDNECQSRNDFHLADKKYRVYSDVNAEQLECHARSSDSQSFGISYISDYGDSSSKKSQSSFSSSDTISNVTENTASDDETHSQKCKTDKLHAPSVSVSTDMEKTQGSNSGKIHEDQLRDNGEVSSISSLSETSGTFVEMKPRESPVIDLPPEHKLCREQSSNVKLSTDMFSTIQNGPNVPDSFAAVSSDLSGNLILCGNLQLNELNVGGNSISSDALMHQTEKPGLHSENGDSCLDIAKPIDLAEEACEADSGNLMASSKELIITDAKGLLPCSSLAESEACLGGTVVANKLDATLLAQPDFEIGATVEASAESGNVAELVHIPRSHKANEQQLSDPSSDVSQEEVGNPNFVQELDLEKVFKAVDNEESGNSSIKVHDMEESPATSDTAANCQDDSGSNGHVVSDEPLAEDRPDDTATSTSVAIGSDISGNLSSDPNHFLFVDPAPNCQDDSGNNDHIVSDELLTEDRPYDIGTSTTVAIDSDISGNAPSDSIHSVLVDPVVSGKFLSDAGDPHQPEMEIINEKASPRSLTKSEEQCDEADIPAIKSDSEEVVSASVDLYSLKGDVQSLAPGEQSDTPASDGGVSLQSSDPYAQSNVLPAVCLQETREYLTASLSSQLSEPGTCSLQLPGIPIDQLNDGSVPINEVTAVAPEVSALSSDLATNSNMLEMDQFTFHPSTYTLLDDNTLPPLPPMQWRMAKGDQLFQASHNDMSKNDEGLLPVLSQCSTEQKAQYELSVSEVGTVMPWHPFLPEASEEVKQPYDSGKVGDSYARPTLGEPDCLNNGNEEFSASSNPFLTEPGHSEETHECSSPMFEQDVQSSNPALPLFIDEATSPEHESSSLFEDSLQTSLDNSMDAASEGNSVQHGLREQEELVQDNLDTSITQLSTFQEHPPDTVEEQAPNRVEQQPQTQVEEKTAKIEKYPSDEVIKHPQNDDKEQLPSEFEEHTSKDAEMQAPEDIEDQPCSQAEVQHPREAEKQSQHGILASGGETPQMYSAFALPGLSTSETFFPPHLLALLPINEGGKADGHPTVKPPRPRNPLIDAVAAVDKSKLRKVTDRVQPPVEHKADERDSLLEQIRKKSFNLKPTVGTRPSIQNIQGPRTNLRLAAILEKANAIRQATAGSDEDEDNWSDS